MKVLACVLFLILAAAIDAAPRIAGGSDAPDHKYPYVVSIRRYPGYHICAGTILNKRWILTVANCLINRRSEPLHPFLVTVHVGSNTLSESDGEIYQADNVTIHKDYEYRHELNDIGLVRVDRDIVFSKEVQPVKLPEHNNFETNTSAVVVGWGATWVGGLTSGKMQEITVELISQKTCNDFYTRLEIPFNITEMHICTLTEYEKGGCYNDAGDPLLVDGVQVGSLAFISICAYGNPDGYTRIFSYLDWIKENAVIE